LARKLLVCPIGQHELAVLDKETRFHDFTGVVLVFGRPGLKPT
jgi:hypothetical protein